MSSAPPPLRIRVLLFASYADLVSREEVEVLVPSPATVADVIARLRADVPGAHRLPDRPLAAVNQVHGRLTDPVADRDEVALLPPMAGG
ncbi:MAG: MoaD/ThiS family protein [Gemmatimonadota bacterium]